MSYRKLYNMRNLIIVNEFDSCLIQILKHALGRCQYFH